MALLRLTPIARARCVDEPEQVEQRLKALGLSRTPIDRAIAAGLAGRNETTGTSAPTEAGSLQWFKTVQVLRAELSPAHWKIVNLKNSPLAVSLDKKTALLVMTGDSATGKKEEDPTNKNAKGQMTRNIIRGQLELFRYAKNKHAGTQIWVLLYHYDPQANEVRYELSHATAFDKKNITRFNERLLLGSIPNHPDAFVLPQEAPVLPDVVDVRLKKTGS